MPVVKSHLRRVRIAKAICTAILLSLSIFGLYLIAQRRGDNHAELEVAESVQWKRYSIETRDSLIKAGRNVVVFVFAELSPASPLALREFGASRVSEVCRENCAMLLLKYDDWNDPNIRSVWGDVGHNKEPFVVLYSPDASAVAFDPFSGAPLCR
jgi:hypothetical protein